MTQPNRLDGGVGYHGSSPLTCNNTVEDDAHFGMHWVSASVHVFHSGSTQELGAGNT